MLKKINQLSIRFFFVIFLFILFLLFSTNKIYAAGLSLSPSSSTVSVGNIVSVKVYVNTNNKSINNAEATIEFPVDMLDVVSITKSSSIFSLWVEEPSFSNYTGKIIFNGGVPNPGFIGSNGYIASITFKAKKQGTASIIFSEGAVRENDGLGTDILTSKNGSVIQIGIPKKIEVPVVPVVPEAAKNSLPLKPVVSSDTHPDQESWYPLNTASFSWKIPSGVTSIQTLLNKVPNATPTITYDNSVSQKTLSNLNDGIYYLHIRYFNGAGWGPINNYKIKIDTSVPQPFAPTIRSEGNNNYIKLNAVDSVSGMDHYLLNIDNVERIKVDLNELINGEYLLPIEKEGIHNINITAFDKAGNNTNADVVLSSPSIGAPELSLSKTEILVGDNVTITGKTNYPDKKVEVSLQQGSDEVKKYTQTTSADGSFSVVTDNIKEKGLYNIWAEVIISDRAHSLPSETLYLKVKENKVVSTTLSLIYPMLGIIAIVILLIILIIIIYIGWYKFFGLRRKIKKELEKTTLDVHRAMLLIKDELNKQLEALEGIKVDRELNKQEKIIFDEIKSNIDDIDTFIKKKLNKII